MKLTNKILEAVNRGIKFALDDFEDQEDIQGQTNSKVKYKGGINEYLDLMKEVVDLDLPSGTLWCKYNLGVKPTKLSKAKNWYGSYYAWGELEGNKPQYNWKNYKFGDDLCGLNKYSDDSEFGLNGFTDNLTKLLPEDDAAYQFKKCHNFKFHIPTKEQCEELLKYTQNYWVNNYDPNKIKHNPKDDGGIQSLNGRVFEGKNKNQLFIPAAGCCDESDIYNVGSYCYLWSSSLFTLINFSYNAYSMYFNSDEAGVNGENRYGGSSVRPVINVNDII